MEITQHFLTKKVCGYTGPVGRTYIPYPRTVPIPCCTVPIPCPYRTRTQKSLLTYRTRTQKNPPQYPSVMPRQTALLSYLFEFGPQKKKGRYYYILSYMFLCMCHILGNRFPGRSGWPSVSTLPLSNLVLSSLGVNVGTQLKQNYLTKK